MKKNLLDLEQDSFHKVERIFNDGDIISLNLPMHLKVSPWSNGGVAIERGPLVYSLDIPAKTEIDTLDKNSSKEFPAYNMTPCCIMELRTCYTR